MGDKPINILFLFNCIWQIGVDNHTPTYEAMIKLCQMMLLYIGRHLIPSWIAMDFFSSIFVIDVQYWFGQQFPIYIIALFG